VFNTKWAVFRLYHGKHKLHLWWDDVSFALDQHT
jgi:hypothetical protein